MSIKSASAKESTEWPKGEPRRVLKYWKPSELGLFVPLLVLGVFFSLIHILGWGLPTWREARRWTSARCTVINRYVHSWAFPDGETRYRPEILIRFRDRGGREFLCRAFDRSTLSQDEGYVYTAEEANRIVAPFLPGQVRTCHYLTEQPERAVLKRDREIWGWLFLPIPVSVAAFGAVALFWIAKKRSASQEWFAKPIRKPERFPTVPAARQINESPGIDLAYRLPMFVSPIAQNLAGLALAAVWNLIAFGTFFFVLSVRTNRFELVMALLFGLVFCGTGIAALFVFLRRIFQILRTGTTIIEISDHPLSPNRKYRLSLRQNGKLAAKTYAVDLCCDEVTHYSKGTDTITHKKEVLRIPLFARNDFHVRSGETVREEFFLKIPAGAMHSFRAGANEVRWKISILIKTGKTGTLLRECPVIVLPYSPDAS